MAMTSTPPGQWATATATATTALRGLVIACCCLLALVVPSDAAGRLLRHPTRGLQKEERVLKDHRNVTSMLSSLCLQEEGLEEFYFSEFMAESDEPVVLLEEGPFKLVAACQTISYSYSDWDYYYSSWYSSSSSYYYKSHSPYFSYGPTSPGYTSHESSSTWTPWSSPYSTYTGSYDFDDGYFTDDYWQDGIHTESMATLELTYTADDSDYLFGSPSYTRYPDEEKIIGSYEAGENRTQIVFSGYDGGWSSDATLQSLSGAYFTTNGDNTIGFHNANAVYHGNPDDYSFPPGIDCMMAGVISYLVPSN